MVPQQDSYQHQAQIDQDDIFQYNRDPGFFGVAMYDLERFYGTKVSFYKGTDSYKSYKLVQTPNFSFWLMPYV